MLKDKMANKIIGTALLIVCVFVVIFAIISAWNWHLLSGWVYGSFVALVGYCVNVILITIFLRLAKSKGFGITLGLLRTFLQMGYHMIMFLILIVVNTYWTNGNVFEIHKTSDVVDPLNLFAYLGAIGVYPISTLIAQLPIYKKKGKVEDAKG